MVFHVILVFAHQTEGVKMTASENKNRFNILDIIIIIMLIALITGLFFRNNIKELLNSDKSSEITYVFEIKQLDDVRLSYLKPNTLLSEKDRGSAMGRVASVTSQKSVITEYTADGNVIRIEKDELFDVTVKAVASGFKSDTGVFLNGDVSIIPGKSYSIITSIAVYEITILSVN